MATWNTLGTLSTDLEGTGTFVIRVKGWCWRLNRTWHCLIITWRWHVDPCRVHRNTRLRAVWGICWSRSTVRNHRRRSCHWLDWLVLWYSVPITTFDDDNYCYNDSSYYSNDNTSDGSTWHSALVVIIVIIVGVFRSITASRSSCTLRNRQSNIHKVIVTNHITAYGPNKIIPLI